MITSILNYVNAIPVETLCVWVISFTLITTFVSTLLIGRGVKVKLTDYLWFLLFVLILNAIMITLLSVFNASDPVNAIAFTVTCTLIVISYKALIVRSKTTATS